MMPKATRLFGAIAALLTIPVLLAACGYRPLSRIYETPGLEGGKPVAVHMPMWTNATNEFGLETDVYNTVSDWLQGSNHILLKKKPAEAEYLLEGVISAIDLSSSRGTVRLTVRYSLKNTATDKLIWPESSSVFAKSYLITDDAAATTSERQKALHEIADNIGEKIYIRFLNTIAELRKQQATPPVAAPQDKTGAAE